MKVNYTVRRAHGTSYAFLAEAYVKGRYHCAVADTKWGAKRRLRRKIRQRLRETVETVERGQWSL